MVILVVVLVLTVSLVISLSVGGALYLARQRLDAVELRDGSQEPEVSAAEISFPSGGPNLGVGAVDHPKALLGR